MYYTEHIRPYVRRQIGTIIIHGAYVPSLYNENAPNKNRIRIPRRSPTESLTLLRLHPSPEKQ